MALVRDWTLFSIASAHTACRPVNQHGERVTPSDFEAYRLSHKVLGPCCLCPFQDRDVRNYKESPIFMVGLGRYAGEYVAACADNRCSYFGRSRTRLITTTV